MRCYCHEQEAVGVCKYCGRSVCPECAAEVGKILACKARCETEVEAMLKINANALQYSRSVKQARLIGPTIFVILGLLLINLGSGQDRSIVGAGISLVFIALVILIINIRMAKKLKT